MQSKNRHALLLSLVLTVALLAAPAFADVTISINNVDPPGIGFNDPTVVAPVGGNPGTTLGDQRLNVFELAADLWGTTLDSPVPVVVQATFSPLACSPTSGTLGAAGTIQIFAFNPPAPPGAIDTTWYHSALFNKLAGIDVTPGPPDPGLLVPPFNDDIVAFFNGDIGVNPNCLTGLDWYYGLDNNAPAGTIDLLNVVMHEIAHGLGFSNFVNETDGTGPAGLPDIYTVFSLDTTTGLHWNEMTDAERAASAINDGNVVWDGAEVTSRADQVLDRRPRVRGILPNFGSLEAGAASFGPAIGGFGTFGFVRLVDDGVGTTSDGCEAITNSLNFRIALIDRGGCSFVQKVQNAQAAGAKGVILVNNVAGGGPLSPGGTDPSITIPTLGISLEDGDTIKNALPFVFVNLGRFQNLLSGANDDGLVKLYAPTTVAPGSSISHWDISATPNLLMEPFNTSTIQASVSTDLTPFLFLDEGWMLNDSDADGVFDVEDACPASTLGGNVVIDGCDTGVANAVTAGGCSITDLVDECAADASSHGQFVSCVALTGLQLWKEGVISFGDKISLLSCAIPADIP